MATFDPRDVILETAKLMCAAALTAPKTKGVNLLTVFYLLPEDFKPLYPAMQELSHKYDPLRPNHPFQRDLVTLKKADCLVVIGSRRKLMDIAGCDACGFRGEPNGCRAAAKVGAACAYNAKDLGIALSSAAIVAHQRFVDSRIIDSVGRAIINYKLYSEYSQGHIFDAAAIAISISGKNPFFDRLEEKVEAEARASKSGSA